MVDAQSASPQLPGVTYYGVEATHVNMCKFESSIAPGYRNLAASLREWVGAAPSVVEGRWVEEDAERVARFRHAEREARERIARLGAGGSGRSSPKVTQQQQFAGYGWRAPPFSGSVLPVLEGDDDSEFGPLGSGGLPGFVGERVVEIEEVGYEYAGPTRVVGGKARSG